MNKQVGDEDFPLSQNVPKRIDEPFSCSRISYFLYRGISQYLGVGEEERIEDHNGIRLMRQLDPDHELVGFQGQIQFVQFLDNTFFRLYLNDHGDDPVLEIVGGLRSGGLWTALDGQLMVEKLTVSLPLKGLPAKCPAMKIISKILITVNELSTNPSCYHEEYWTGHGFA